MAILRTKKECLDLQAKRNYYDDQFGKREIRANIYRVQHYIIDTISGLLFEYPQTKIIKFRLSYYTYTNLNLKIVTQEIINSTIIPEIKRILESKYWNILDIQIKRNWFLQCFKIKIVLGD